MIQVSTRKIIIIAALFAGLLIFTYRLGYSRFHCATGQSSGISCAGLRNSAILWSGQDSNSRNVQVTRSLLGANVAFLGNHINYDIQGLIYKPCYKALRPNEKLVDAIYVQSPSSYSFLVLVAIAKTSTNPRAIPGKFDIVRQTAKGGLILKDARDRLFYYTGYLIANPEWKSLYPGQSLKENVCKNLEQMAFCTTQNAFAVTLIKPSDSSRDVPALILLK